MDKFDILDTVRINKQRKLIKNRKEVGPKGSLLKNIDESSRTICRQRLKIKISC